jgi:hypothetical protein
VKECCYANRCCRREGEGKGVERCGCGAGGGALCIRRARQKISCIVTS